MTARIGRRRGLGGGHRSSHHDVADVTLRLAVLLHAGIAPDRAWMHTAETVGTAQTTAIAVRIASGIPAARAIFDEGIRWRSLAAAWHIATEVGAPLAATLRGFSDALRNAADTADEVAVALAEPAGTARLMAWLPLAGVLLGIGVGLDPLAALRYPIGIACIVVGLVLMAMAHGWTRRLVRAARPPEALPGLRAELCAIALSGGISIDRALALVESQIEHGGEVRSAATARRVLRPGASGAGERRGGAIMRILDLSRAAGVPAVELLRAEAERERRTARVEGRLGAVRLSRRLLIPLGICTLPAFMLLTVAPLILSVLSATVTGAM